MARDGDPVECDPLTFKKCLFYRAPSTPPVSAAKLPLALLCYRCAASAIQELQVSSNGHHVADAGSLRSGKIDGRRAPARDVAINADWSASVLSLRQVLARLRRDGRDTSGLHAIAESLQFAVVPDSAPVAAVIPLERILALPSSPIPRR
jgi:hypothetical protein